MNNQSYVRHVRIDKDLAKLDENGYLDLSKLQLSSAQYKLHPVAIMHNGSSAINIRGLLFCDNPPLDIETFTVIGQRPVALPFKHIYKDGTDYNNTEIFVLGTPTA